MDAKETFEDLYIDPIDKPWGATQNLRMASSDVDNYFVYFALDRNNSQINENLNFISTVTQPSVRAYALEDDPGYIVYEVTYDQVFPIYSREPSNVYTSFFSYHNVSFVDYYTGRKFPAINLSTQIDSFGVTGNVFYKGEKYHLGYYEFRSQEHVSSNTESAGDGYVFLKQKLVLHTTSYFIVPEFYRGILMCVFVANDTDTPLSEIMADNSPYFEPRSTRTRRKTQRPGFDVPGHRIHGKPQARCKDVYQAVPRPHVGHCNLQYLQRCCSGTPDGIPSESHGGS